MKMSIADSSLERGYRSASSDGEFWRNGYHSNPPFPNLDLEWSGSSPNRGGVRTPRPRSLRNPDARGASLKKPFAFGRLVGQSAKGLWVKGPRPRVKKVALAPNSGRRPPCAGKCEVVRVRSGAIQMQGCCTSSGFGST